MFDDYDDDDLITCEHCGKRHYPEVGWGHICPEGIEASKRETEEHERKYLGSGEKVKFRLTIDVECYNTRDAISHALTEIEMNSSSKIVENENFTVTGRDKLMGCSWKIKKETK